MKTLFWSAGISTSNHWTFLRNPINLSFGQYSKPFLRNRDMISRFPLACLVAVFAAGSSRAAIVTLYDSAGYEAFADGALGGQDGWVADPVFEVQSSLAFSGSRAVQVTSSGASAVATAPLLSTFTPDVGDTVVVEASIARTLSSPGSTSFGVSIYDGSTAEILSFGLFNDIGSGTIRPFYTDSIV